MKGFPTSKGTEKHKKELKSPVKQNEGEKTNGKIYADKVQQEKEKYGKTGEFVEAVQQFEDKVIYGAKTISKLLNFSGGGVLKLLLEPLSASAATLEGTGLIPEYSEEEMAKSEAEYKQYEDAYKKAAAKHTKSLLKNEDYINLNANEKMKFLVEEGKNFRKQFDSNYTAAKLVMDAANKTINKKDN